MDDSKSLGDKPHAFLWLLLHLSPLLPLFCKHERFSEVKEVDSILLCGFAVAVRMAAVGYRSEYVMGILVFVFLSQ